MEPRTKSDLSKWPKLKKLSDSVDFESEDCAIEMGLLQSFQNKTHYEILGVTPDAKLEEIKVAYREIARVYHPDSRFFDEFQMEPLTSEDVEIFKIVTNAYNVLRNPKTREKYDKKIGARCKVWSSGDGSAQNANSASQPKTTKDWNQPDSSTSADKWKTRSTPNTYNSINSLSGKFQSVGNSDDMAMSGSRFGRWAHFEAQEHRRQKAKKPLLIITFGIFALSFMIIISVAAKLVFG